MASSPLEGYPGTQSNEPSGRTTAQGEEAAGLVMTNVMSVNLSGPQSPHLCKGALATVMPNFLPSILSTIIFTWGQEVKRTNSPW